MLDSGKTSNLKASMKRVGAVITADSSAGVISSVAHQPAQAQAGVCPSGTKEYTLGAGEHLHKVAENHGKGQQEDNGWKEIKDPKTGETFREEQLNDLKEGQKVCIPDNWNASPKREIRWHRVLINYATPP